MSEKPDITRKASPPALVEVKKQIRKKYVGQAGIHGVGIRSKENVVRLYANKDRGDQQEHLIGSIRREIAPFVLDVIFDEAPVMLEGIRTNQKG